MTGVVLLITQVFVPLLFIFWLSHPPLKDGVWASRTNWVVHVIVTGGVVAFALTAGSQGWTSIYLGALVLVSFIVMLVRSFLHLPANWTPIRFRRSWSEMLFVGIQLFFGLVFLPISIYAFTGHTMEGDPVALDFPLKDGVYIVGHGGSNPLVNYHNMSKEQAYALDILKLNPYGTRASGFYPEDLSRYAIYGDTLYSPCDGKVREAVNDLPEYAPPKRGEGHPAGNRVVLECKGVRVYLVHMVPGSVTVNSKDTVTQGEPVGRVGNSGNTSEPHLHIHATRDGVGVPITFDDRFLVKNSLIWH